MIITDIRKSKRDTYTELSALMDGHRLWYRVPVEYEVSANGDVFLAAGLFPAMVKGEDLEVDPAIPISPKLVRGMMHLQEIFQCWNPALKKIDIHGIKFASESTNPGIGSFFSGGIDGACTLLDHKEEITHLIYVNGFDFEMTEEDFSNGILRNRRIADSFNKSLIPIETNFKPFLARYRVNRLLSFGSCLASIAHTLGFNKTYIPSSQTYNELGPSGSHPLTDPLWSSEATEIVHDGAHRKRTEKTQMLIHNHVLMDNLVVCWEEPNKNCGKCGKCLRTMVTLKLLGTKSFAFPGDLRLRDVATQRIRSNSYIPYFHELLELAEKKNDRKMANALKRCLRRNDILIFLQDLDGRCLGGTLRKVFQYFKYGHLPKGSKVINPSP